MKPGTRPMPTQLKLLRGNPGKRALPDEPEPFIDPTMPEPPDFLEGYAADEWWGTGTELHRLGLLTRVDVTTFAAYCAAYGQWRQASESLARMAKGDPVMHGLIIKSKYGDAIQNPLVYVARKAAAEMVRFGAEFGLSPSSRTRIATGDSIDSKPSKFAGLLAS